LLKVDLLPAHYAVARRNRSVIVLTIPILVAVALVWLLALANTKSAIDKTQAELDQVTQVANQVRQLQGEKQAKEADLKPIQDEITFVASADRSGGVYWDRFHQINKYIYDRAVMTNFSITPPAAVSFTVRLNSLGDAGRFLLNLIRCPHITGALRVAPGVPPACRQAAPALPLHRVPPAHRREQPARPLREAQVRLPRPP